MAELTSDFVEPAPPAQALAPAARRSTLYSIYIMSLLAVIGLLATADRSILSVLLVPIKKDLHASDTAMGALTGLAYTLVYVVVALPVARLADTGVRRTIVAAGVAVWSVMTAVCGLASSYVALLLARMGVAAGEACNLPSGMSMIGDLFPLKHRGTALGTMMIGSALGTAFGAVVASQLAARFSWHVAFFVMGLPGFVMAIIFFLTVPEPQRGAHDGAAANHAGFSNWRASVAYLSSIPSFWPLAVANVFVGLSFSTFLTWMPTFLMRVMGLSMTHMGALWSVVSLPAIPAVILGGFVSDRLAARGARWRVLFMAILLVIGVPIYVTLLNSNSLAVVGAMMFIYAGTIAPVATIIYAANMDIVRPRARGMMAVIGMVGLTVLGTGLGPIFIGQLNDRFQHIWGDQALRHTLYAVPCFLTIAALGFLWASRTTDRDAEAARSA
jgi:MFS family permease